MHIEIKKITSAIIPVIKTMLAIIIPAVSPILLLSEAVLVVGVGNSIIRINNDYLNNQTLYLPFTHTLSMPFQLPSLRHILLSLPSSLYPELQVKLHTSR